MNRFSFSTLVFAIVLLIASLIGSLTNLVFGYAVFIGLFGSFVLQGFRNIPNNPPQQGVLTIFGNRRPVVLHEGWKFLPFFPYVFGYIGVEVKRIPKIFTVTVKTPDRADSEIPIEITYRPVNLLPALTGTSDGEDIFDGFIRFLNNGGNEGIESQLKGKIDERVREWAIADGEGPQNWEELQKSRLEAVSVLTKTIGFNHVTEIPVYAQRVPTVIWMKFFAEPRPTEAFMEKEKQWAENDWEKVKGVIKSFSHDENEREKLVAKLKVAVSKRLEEVKKLRAGSGVIFIEDLGIKIERLNVGDVKVLGKVAEASEKEAEEKQQREGEKLELEHVRNRISELMKEPYKFSAEQALEIIQTERKKVVKTVNEQKLNISPETREMLKEVIPGTLNVLASVFRKGV